jgi:hypothetical protein
MKSKRYRKQKEEINHKTRLAAKAKRQKDIIPRKEMEELLDAFEEEDVKRYLIRPVGNMFGGPPGTTKWLTCPVCGKKLKKNKKYCSRECFYNRNK